MKPEVRGYRMVEDGILNEEKLSLFDAPEIYFFDDVSENLRTAKKMGWTTILIDVDKQDASHIDYQYFSVKQALKDMFEKNIL
jgi:FMN phosphatase YigB (HAD superfamily)